MVCKGEKHHNKFVQGGPHATSETGQAGQVLTRVHNKHNEFPPLPYNTRISMNYYYCCSWSWSKRNEKSKIKYLRNQLSNIWRIKYMSDQIYGRSNIKRPSLLQQWVGPGPRFVPGCNMKPLMKDKLGNGKCKMLVANTIGWCKVHTHSNTHTYANKHNAK